MLTHTSWHCLCTTSVVCWRWPYSGKHSNINIKPLHLAPFLRDWKIFLWWNYTQTYITALSLRYYCCMLTWTYFLAALNIVKFMATHCVKLHLLETERLLWEISHIHMSWHLCNAWVICWPWLSSIEPSQYDAISTSCACLNSLEKIFFSLTKASRGILVQLSKSSILPPFYNKYDVIMWLSILTIQATNFLFVVNYAIYINHKPIYNKS